MPINIGVIEGSLNLVDQLSGPLSKASDKLNQFSTNTIARASSSIKSASSTIQQSFDGISRKVNSTLKDLEKSSQKIEKFGRQLSNVGSQLTTTVTAPIVAVGGLSVKAASDFEDSFAGVNKTVDGITDSVGNLTKVGAELQQGLRDLAAGPKPIPIDVNELNAIAEAAGQLGIAREDILDFTKVMAQLGETTNLTSDEAATSIAQLQNIFSAPGKEVDKFGATLVALGNVGASTEKQILEMGLRIAGAGVQIGLTQGQVLAIANSLASVGVEAEAGGSAISKTMIDMAVSVEKGGKELHNFAVVAGMTEEQFKKAFKEDAAGALVSFFEGLGKIKDSGGSVLKVLTDMGVTQIRERDAMLRLSGAGTLLRDSLNLQAKAWQENTALTAEAEKRHKTFSSQLKIVYQRIKDAAITLGSSLIPVLKDMMGLIEPSIKLIASFAQRFGELPKPIRAIILVIGGALAVIGPFLFVLGQIVIAFGAVAGAAPAVVSAITAIGAAVNGVLLIIPLLLLGINEIIVQWTKAKQAAIEYDVASANIEGRALRFAQDISTSGGRTTKSAFAQATADVAELRKGIEKVEGKVQSLRNELKDPKGRSPSLVRSELGDSESDLRNKIAAYERARSAISRVKEVIDDVKQSTPTNKPLFPDPIDPDIWTKGNKQISDTIANLERAAEKAKALLLVTQKGGSIGLRDEEDRQAAIDQLLEEQNRLKEQGLSLTSEQVKRITNAVLAEREYTRELQLLLKVQSMVGQLAYEPVNALEQMEIRLKRNMPLWLAMEELNRKNAIQLSNINARLDAASKGALKAFDWKIPLEDLQAAADLTEQMMSNAERQAKALIEAARLRDQGVISQGIYDRVRQSQASPMWNEAEQAQRELVDQIIAGFVSIGEVGKVEINRINDAFAPYADNADMVIAKEMAITQIRNEMLDQYLSQWGSFFNTLAGLFGGLFQQIASAINNIQAANKAGNQLGGMMQNMGAGSWASSLGGVFATVQVFYEIYKAVDTMIKKQKMARWGDVTSLNVTNHDWSSPSYFGKYGQEVDKALRGLINEVINSISAVLKDLPQITIRARKDGKEFAAYVAGVWVGTFKDAQSAVEEAVAYALTNATFDFIGPEFRKALEASLGKTFDELQANIATATTVRAARLGNVGVNYSDIANKYNQEIAAAVKLGLATDDLIRARTRELEATKNSVLGIDTSTSDKLRDIASLNAGMADAAGGMRASMEQLIADTMAQIARLEKPPQISRGETGQISQSPLAEQDAALDSELAKLRAALAQYIAELDKIPQALSDQEINMGIFDALYKYLEGNKKYAADAVKYAKLKVEIEFQTIKAQLMLLGKWEEFSSMFTDAYNAAMAAAGNAGKGGKGRGSGKQDDVQSFIRDKQEQLATAGMSDYQRQLHELNKAYDEQIKAAGKNSQAIAQLTQLRAQEIALINQQKIQDTVNKFQQFVNGTNQFDEVRKTAEGVIKSIEESPMGDARKAAMINRVMKAMSDQLLKLAQQSALSLFGEMLQDMEKFGATDAMMAEARRQQAILEHVLKMAHYQAEIELLRAQGNLAPEIMKALDDAFHFLQTIDPTKFMPGSSNGSTNNAGSAGFDRMQKEAEDAYDAIKAALETLRKYQSDELDPFTKAIQEINDDFISIRKALGNTSEVIATFNKALQRTVDEYLQPIIDSQRDLFYGSNSTASVEQQWMTIRQQQSDIMKRFRSGDLSVLEDIPDFGNQLLDLTAQMSPRGSQGFRSISDEWNDFLSEVRRTTPAIAASTVMGTTENPMAVDGISDLVDVGEAQADKLSMIYDETYRGAVATEALLDRISTYGGLNGVL